MENIAAHFVGASGAISLALIAFSVVFIVLAALSLMIVANRFVAEQVERMGSSASAPAAPKKKAATPKPAPAATPAAAPQAPAPSAASVMDNGELVAVITAAIAATLGSGAEILDIRPASPTSVRRHRRVGPLWRSCAKTSAMEGLD